MERCRGDGRARFDASAPRPPQRLPDGRPVHPVKSANARINRDSSRKSRPSTRTAPPSTTSVRTHHPGIKGIPQQRLRSYWVRCGGHRTQHRPRSCAMPPHTRDWQDGNTCLHLIEAHPPIEGDVFCRLLHHHPIHRRFLRSVPTCWLLRGLPQRETGKCLSHRGLQSRPLAERHKHRRIIDRFLLSNLMVGGGDAGWGRIDAMLLISKFAIHNFHPPAGPMLTRFPTNTGVQSIRQGRNHPRQQWHPRQAGAGGHEAGTLADVQSQ